MKQTSAHSPRQTLAKMACLGFLALVTGLPLACEHVVSQPSAAGQSKQPQPPLLRLAFSQWLEGKLEPCGCASAQSGGMDRRGYWLKRNKHLYDLALEGGNLIESNNPFEDLKLQTSLIVLRGHLEEQGYGALPLGPVDLTMGIQTLRDYDEAWGPVFFCTDLRQKKGDKLTAPFATHRILEAGKYKILLLDLAQHVAGKSAGDSASEAPDDLVFVDPKTAIEEALAKAGKRGTDYDLVACFAYEREDQGLRKLLPQVPGVDLLIGQVRDLHLMGGNKAEVHERKEPVHGVRRTSLIFPGGQGRRLLLWKGRPDAGQGWKTDRLEVIDLPAKRSERKNAQGMPLTADGDIWMQLRELKTQIAEQNMVEKLADQRPTANGARFVGNKACKDCHAQAYRIWTNSVHADAWEALVERDKKDGLPMTQQPDCVSCHTVGFGQVSGYKSPTKTPKLLAVGCEACHGAGSKHVESMQALPKEPTAEQTKAAVKQGALLPATAAICVRCHDSEQSPGFQFNDRWKRIQHK